MASTFSPLLGIELIGIGDQDNSWGTTNNINLGTLIEQAIAGTTTIDVTLGDITLTNYNGAADQARNAVIRVTGTPGVTRNVTAPASSKVYFVINGSDHEIVLKTATSTGLTIPAGAVVSSCYDTTTSDFYLVGYPATSLNTAGTLVLRDASGNFVAGTITATQFVGELVGVINGVTTGTTQAANDNSTKLATTAYADNAVATSAATKADKTTTISAGTGLSGGGNLSANRTLSITNTGVTAATYGSATKIPVLAVNAQGQITIATEEAIATTTTGAGTLTASGQTFTVQTGISGKCLIQLSAGFRALYGNYGTATVNMVIGGSTVATDTATYYEYASRYSGDHAVLMYQYSGAANSTITVTFTYSAPGQFTKAFYSYTGT